MTAQERYLEWKNYVKDEELSDELARLDGNDPEIADRFGKALAFEENGLRGLLGAGTNRMNLYTVRKATQGLSAYLLSQKETPAVAVAYDTRHNSERFAKEAASVLAANGIKVWFYAAPAPAPMLSYAVRERFCDAGIVITAGGCAAAYNGYKVYGADGCRIGSEEAAAIAAKIEETDALRGALTVSFEESVTEKKIILLPDSFWRRYYARVLKEGVDRAHHYENDLTIVYTPLCGTGAVPVVTTLSLGGFGNVAVVPEQEKPDSAFSTCETPDPSCREALSPALKQAEACGADLILATDPDCDSLGVASKEANGYRLFTGAELGVLLLDFIAAARKENGEMPENPLAVVPETLSEALENAAASHGIELKKVPAGFRSVGTAISGLAEMGQEERFLFGFTKDGGFLTGTYAREADGVNGALLVCELANYWKLRGKTLGEVCDDLLKRSEKP